MNTFFFFWCFVFIVLFEIGFIFKHLTWVGVLVYFYWVKDLNNFLKPPLTKSWSTFISNKTFFTVAVILMYSSQKTNGGGMRSYPCYVLCVCVCENLVTCGIQQMSTFYTTWRRAVPACHRALGHHWHVCHLRERAWKLFPLHGILQTVALISPAERRSEPKRLWMVVICCSLHLPPVNTESHEELWVRET